MSLLQTMIDLLFPPRCPFCRMLLCSAGAEENDLLPWGGANGALQTLLCSNCVAELPWLIHSCPRCARPFPSEGDHCPYCGDRVVAYDYVCALGSYQGVMRHTLHRFKYKGEKALAVPLGRLLAARLSDMPWFFKVDMLIPVPLSPERQRNRGYNQAALLTQTLSRELGIPNAELLQRTKDTESQSTLGRNARWENINGAFAAKDKERPKGKKLLLVDDILTSGATAHAAAQVLKEAGATEVNLAVIAR